MKILIYGAGAVGGYLGARLQQHGHDLTLVTREVTADVINSNGLILTEDDETIRTTPIALTSIAQAFTTDRSADYDLIIMSMKSYDLRPALDHLVAFCPSPPLSSPCKMALASNNRSANSMAPSASSPAP